MCPVGWFWFQPVRIFRVRGMVITRKRTSTMSFTLLGRCMSPAPAPLLQTPSMGHPMLMSIKSTSYSFCMMRCVYVYVGCVWCVGPKKNTKKKTKNEDEDEGEIEGEERKRGGKGQVVCEEQREKAP